MTPSLDTITTMRTILTMTMSSIMIMGTATAMKPRMDMIMPVWNPSIRAMIIRS